MEGSKRVLLVCNVWNYTCKYCSLMLHTESCFNAFSRVDVRVDVKIPGGVQTYVIDLRGERCVIVSNPNISMKPLMLPPYLE